MGFGVVFWFVAVFGVSFVSSQIIIPGKQIIQNCNLSLVASIDNLIIRAYVFDFLEFAETNFTTMEKDVRKIQCQYFKGNLSLFIKQAELDWGDCMIDYEYFGGFADETLHNFMDFFCENDKHYIAEYFAEGAKKCRSDILKPLYDRCLSPLLSSSGKKDYDLSMGSFLIPQRKDHLCRELTGMKPCIISTLEEYCFPLATYNRLSAELYTKTIKSCDGYLTYMTDMTAPSYTWTAAPSAIGWTLFVIFSIIAFIVRLCLVRKCMGEINNSTHPTPPVPNSFDSNEETGDSNGQRDGDSLYILLYRDPASKQKSISSQALIRD